MISISELLNNSLYAPIKKFYSINNIWKKSVPENISEETTPVKIDAKGVLLVLVHNSILTTELPYLKKEIIKKLSENGLDASDIKFKVCPSLETYEAPPKPLNKITDKELFFIEKFSHQIDNEKLREAYKKALTAYFKRYTLEDFINGIN